MTVDYIGILAAYLHEHGDIAAVRVSSAQAQGRAKQYPYWGVARYVIRFTRDGHMTAACTRRAASDRRSKRLAERDARDEATSSGAIVITGRGRLSAYDAQEIVQAVLPVVPRLVG